MDTIMVKSPDAASREKLATLYARWHTRPATSRRHGDPTRAPYHATAELADADAAADIEASFLAAAILD
jgi:hypothetical protein